MCFILVVLVLIDIAKIGLMCIFCLVVSDHSKHNSSHGCSSTDAKRKPMDTTLLR